MARILFEGVLLIAIGAISGALFLYVLRRYTPLARRLQQARNRRRIEREIALDCPIHGMQREEELVRLPSGDTVCPHCFKESVWQVR